MGNMCSSYLTDIHSDPKNYRSYSSSINTKYLQLNHFHYLATLGEGAFAKVILVRRKSNQELYAVKMIQTERLEDLAKREFARFERQVLVEFQNPFIIKLHHIFESFGKLCFVLDFMQGGSLGFHLKKYSKFKPSAAVFFAAEVLVALEILHKREFIYRDLKPENILIDMDGHIKLADFNLSTTTEDLSDRICGTPEYAAPEVINGDIQGIEVDFWGLGVLIFHMIQGNTPFEAANNYDTCKNIVTGRYGFTSCFDKNTVDLISRLLVVNPRERLASYRLIKEHKFFMGIDWQLVERRMMASPLKLSAKDPCDLKYFPKKKYPPVSMEFDQSIDINASVLEQSSQFSEFSYNSEIN